MYEAAVVNAGDMRRSGGIFWSQEHRCFIFPDTLSSQIITRLESKLGSFLSTNPALQFVLYINHYKENQGPLKIGRVGKTGYEFSPTNAFISPRWGGFLIANEVVRNISAQTDLRMSGREVMSVFIAQLRRLLGFPSLKLFNELEPNAVGTNKMGIQSSRGWELDQLKRIRTLENTLGSIDTLTALSDLLDEIGNLVIRDEIGTEIQKAVSSIRSVHEFLDNSDLENAFRASLVALESSDKAFFDESLLELLYFPGDQKCIRGLHTAIFAGGHSSDLIDTPVVALVAKQKALKTEFRLFTGTHALMDACAAVDRDVTKVIEKFNNLKSSIVRHCDDAYSKLDNIRDVLTANPEASMSVAEVFRLTGAVNGAKEMAQKVAAQHRDLHNAVSKVGKAIDRILDRNYDSKTMLAL
ncbi:unnamed protein product, partial [Notodromas monacha]